MIGGVSLSSPSKRFASLALPAAAMREITDALVIFSMSIIAYMLVADWGGLGILRTILGFQPEKPSFLYFGGMALVVFSARRIGDQRRERSERMAAEHRAHTVSLRDPLTQLPNRRQFQNDVGAALKISSNKMSVLLLGLHQFKKLNEVYGHLGCLRRWLRGYVSAPTPVTSSPGSATTNLPCVCRERIPKTRVRLPVR
jgi:predicted signal transduction protein with EAL and GGDEF domain